jgi:hypothetical protein
MEFDLNSNYDGVLMYLVHRGESSFNQVFSDANGVWNDYYQVGASSYGVAETNIALYPDAEILSSNHVKKTPALLFVLVEGGQMTQLLSKLSGTPSYNKIRNEFVRLIKWRNENPSKGIGSGDPNISDADGKGGIGLFDVFRLDCDQLPESLKGLCDLLEGFKWLLLLLIILLALTMIKKIID